MWCILWHVLWGPSRRETLCHCDRFRREMVFSYRPVLQRHLVINLRSQGKSGMRGERKLCFFVTAPIHYSFGLALYLGGGSGCCFSSLSIMPSIARML